MVKAWAGVELDVVDLFAGGGGASEGLTWATGKAPVIAVNHDPEAILMHAMNHPETTHYCESVYDVDPEEVCEGLDIWGVWGSPDCTHFSRAKGGKPRDKNIRGLAWIIVRWAEALEPNVIFVENVPEFLTWGPLDENGYPIKAKEGTTFQKWVHLLHFLGYHVEWRVLSAADYGAPTTRKRLFIIARRDGKPIVWPEPTHGPNASLPYRTAAECIDWSIPCPSIFLTKAEAKAQGFNIRRPLADKTLARIAAGVVRYVIEAEQPFIAPIDANADITVPWAINTRNGERKGQMPRTRSLEEPYWTITANGSQGALVSAFLVKPMPTVTGQGQHLGLVTARMQKVAAFLVAYYGSEKDGQPLTEPMRTIVSRARFGLVTVTIAGEEYAIVDIGMRMLTPRELARAQGFPDSYVLTGSKTSQIGRIGNSVCPPIVEALVAAQL